MRAKLLVLALLWVLPAAAYAQQVSTFMQTTGRTSQPVGHYEFCQRYEVECRVRRVPGVGAHLTDSAYDSLVIVNAQVNATIKPLTDQENYGKFEWWTYPYDGAGDCEDFVLLKRKMLIEQYGWSPNDLLITVVKQKNGDGHAVLTAVTDQGDFVLDSLSPRVLPWDATPYLYIKRQSQTNSGQWVSINDTHLPYTAAVR